jgi:hypothetical protein
MDEYPPSAPCLILAFAVLRLYIFMFAEETNKSIESYMPTQLPAPEWASEGEKIISEYVAKGLPPVPGKHTSWKIPASARTNQW